MLSGTDYIKTVINGLKTWVDKRFRAVNDRVDNLPNPNWNQNDSNALDYIENRPFYKKQGVENLGNTAFVWKSLTNADDEYRVDICVNGSVFHDVVGVVREGEYSGQTFIDYTCGTVTITVDTFYMEVKVVPTSTEWFFCTYGTEIKKIDSQYLPNEPIYLDDPSDEELCYAILNANGSNVIVTRNYLGMTDLFYPCHGYQTKIVGTVISSSFGGVCSYSINPDENPMSISYTPESAGILHYSLSYLYSGSEWRLYKTGFNRITDFEAFREEIYGNAATLTFFKNSNYREYLVYFYTNYDIDKNIIEFTATPMFDGKTITVKKIYINFKTGSIGTSTDTFAICPSKISVGQLIRCKAISNYSHNPTEWEAVDPEDIVHTVVPTVTADDNDKVMKVVDGAWAVGEEAKDFVSYSSPQELTAEQKVQARENIDALDVNYGLTPVEITCAGFGNNPFTRTIYVKKGTFIPIENYSTVTEEISLAWTDFCGSLGVLSKSISSIKNNFLKDIGILIENGVFGENFFDSPSEVIFVSCLPTEDLFSELTIQRYNSDSSKKEFTVKYKNAYGFNFNAPYSLLTNSAASEYISYYNSYLHTSASKWTDDLALTQVAMKSNPTSDMQIATKQYVDNSTAGLTGAMHFRGTSTTDPAVSGPTIPDITTYESGDVVLYGSKEFVYDGTTWKELGDEGSHVLKTQTINGHALTGNIALTADDVGADAAGTAENLINNLNSSQVGGIGKYITTISQSNGQVSATAASFPTSMKNPNALTFGSKTYDGSAARTVTLDDLIGSDTLVFNCGGAV